MKRWTILSHVKEFNNSDKILLEILKNRGIDTREKINKFLNPQLSDLNFKDAGINKKELKLAVKRINKAITNNEKIVVFGDYDVDGICSTAILWETLYSTYKNVDPYIPDRFKEGYGLSTKSIDNVILKYPDVKLLVTVDNGIVANEALKYAKDKSLDVIVTDHHIKGKKDPICCAIIHTTKLCGAGISWVLARELKTKSLKLKTENDTHLELVALATIADLVPLTSANRILVKYGLQALKNTKRAGLIELFKLANIKREDINTYSAGYIIGPRLNAMGRISSAMDSLRLVCMKDSKKAEKFAKSLDLTNKERQALTEQTFSHAKLNYINSTSSKIIFVSSKDYNQGIIGLVASRLVEEYYKPSFVVSIGEKYSKGSARSIHGVNIIDLIRSSSCLREAGGHAMAAGFTVETAKIEKFKKELEKNAELAVNNESLEKKLNIDLVLDLKDVIYSLIEKLNLLAPFGIGNPEPVFASKKVTIEKMRLVGNGNKHLKFTLSQPGAIFDAIAFGMGDMVGEIAIGDTIDIAYVIEEDNWNGNRRLQLKIKDIKNL